MNKITTIEMEFAISNYINPYINLIVPNISWGLHIHECDLFILTKAGYAWEVEIKISKSDLIADKNKKHDPHHLKIKNLYFAIPDYLLQYLSHIPERAGVIVVNIWDNKRPKCETIRKPKPNKNPYKFSDKERLKIATLGAMRIWTLKHKIIKLQNKKEKI